MSKIPSQAGFCVLPWLSVCASVEGVWGRCCIDRSLYSADLANGHHELSEDALGCTEHSPLAPENPRRVQSLGDVFNCESMKTTRRSMLSGEPVAACADCRFREEMGALSYRENMNAQFAHLDWDERIASTDATGAISDGPIFLDLRLGNLCNLRCTMCSWPTSSSHGSGKQARLEPYGEDFFSDFSALSSHVQRLYFAGGEPLLQSGHRRIIEMLLANGRAAFVDLVYNTNLTSLPEWCLEAWRSFKSVDLGVSCDGVGELFESIRSGASWPRFVRNLNQLRAARVSIRLAVTVQRANGRGIAPLVAWANANNYRIDLSNILLFPPAMSIGGERMDVLQAIREDLTEVLASCLSLRQNDNARELERLLAVIQRLIENRTAHDPG